MNKGKYDRSIRLHCPTCGGTDFEHDEHGDGPIRCTSCDRVFTRDELIRENGEIIDANVEEVKKEVVADLQKEMRDMLRKTFSGSKHIKFR